MLEFKTTNMCVALRNKEQSTERLLDLLSLHYVSSMQ